MRFFCTNKFIDYPDNALELQARILDDATKGPQKIPMAYFQDYFSKGGTEEHPQLGNLSALADAIDAQYGIESGLNLVSGMIRARLANLTQQQEHSTADFTPF